MSHRESNEDAVLPTSGGGGGDPPPQPSDPAPRPSPPVWSRDPAYLLAIGFGSGLAPVAPGTWGTLVGVVFYLVLRPLPLSAYVAVTAALFVAGIWLCTRATRYLDEHDHPAIVWDEIVGYLATMIAAPPGWVWIATGFALFRLFDIVKPWPVRVVDRGVRSALGIMLDDLMAAVYAGGSLQLIALASRHL